MDDPRSAHYNSFISVEGMVMPPPDALAKREAVFELMVFVMHNTDPVKRGAGSCLFLHVWAKPNAPTQGCVAMARDVLAQTLSWLNPEQRPVLVQLPEAVYRTHSSAWSLPPLDAAVGEVDHAEGHLRPTPPSSIKAPIP